MEIRESPSTCIAECFSFDTVVVATDDAGNIYVNLYSVVKLANARGYVLGHPNGPASIFDDDGNFVRHIGRRGEGPNEYRYTYVNAAAGDSIEVFDATNGRVTTLTPDAAHHSEHRVPFPIMQSLSIGGETYVNAHVRTFELAGWPLHRLTEDGTFEDSFGMAPDSPGMGPDMPGAEWRRLAAGEDKSMLAAYRPLYWIDEWSLTGDLLRQFQRRADWFPNTVRPRELRPGGQLYPELASIRSVGNDQVLTVVHVPVDGWDRTLVERTSGGRSWYVPENSWDDVYETRVELLDLDRHRVIASETFDLLLWGFVSGAENELFASPADEQGAPELVIIRLGISESLDRG